MQNSSSTPQSGSTARKRRLSPAFLVLVSALLLLVTHLLRPLLIKGSGVYLTFVVLQIMIFLLPMGVWIRTRGDGYLSRLRLKPGKPESLILRIKASIFPEAERAGRWIITERRMPSPRLVGQAFK